MSTTAMIVAGGSSKQDAIETPGDVDWFGVALMEDVSYTIDVKATTNGASLTDPFLTVYDSSGERASVAYPGIDIATLARQLANDDGDDGLNSRLTFELAAAGTYYIAVQSARSWETGFYDLRVAPTARDIIDPCGVSEWHDYFTSDTISSGHAFSGHDPWIALFEWCESFSTD